MNLDKVKTLIEAMATSDLSDLEFSEDGWTLRLSRGSQRPGIAAPSQFSSPVQAKGFAPIAGRTNDASPLPSSAMTDVRAPLSGIVYLRPAPDKPPFVEVGGAVKAGTVVCIIEAMKVFNEIRAETDATIEVVLVNSCDEVEAGQPLLRLARIPA